MPLTKRLIRSGAVWLTIDTLESLHARPVAGKPCPPDEVCVVVVIDHGSHLGRERWVVERGFAHLHNFRRLRTRYERDPQIHQAFLTLACAILCFRGLNSFERFS